jgi:hypothetical protein
MSEKIDCNYLIGLLTDRKYWLVHEMKRCLLDKTASLGTIKRHESELQMIDEQIKHLTKETQQ